MAQSPANGRITQLLHAVNNPFGLLGRGRPALESGNSSDDELEEQQTLELDNFGHTTTQERDGVSSPTETPSYIHHNVVPESYSLPLSVGWYI